MCRKEYYCYSEDDEAQVLCLDYKGNEVIFVAILPKERYGLQKLLTDLSGKKLLGYVGNRECTTVIVYLPRFKVETSVELTDTLSKLGLTKLFTEEADLSAITSDQPLTVGSVTHKALIEVIAPAEAKPFTKCSS